MEVPEVGVATGELDMEYHFLLISLLYLTFYGIH